MPGLKRQYQGWKTRVPEAEVAALALRYQAGLHSPARCHDSLEALRLLEARLAPAIASILQPYGEPEFRSSIDPRALHQQGHVALADIAQTWEPGTSFLSYFFRRFPAAMARHVRDLLPQVGRPSPEATPAGSPDPTSWVAALHERLRGVPALERQVFLELTLQGQWRIDIARRLGIDPATVRRIYQRALARLGDGWRPRFVSRPDMPRLVRVLHACTRPHRTIPGIRFLSSATGLSNQEIRDLIAKLEAARAIVGRRERVAGWLVEPHWAATLARVEAASRISGLPA